MVVRFGFVRIALSILASFLIHPGWHLPPGMLVNINCLRSFILLFAFRSCLHRSATAAPNGSESCHRIYPQRALACCRPSNAPADIVNDRMPRVKTLLKAFMEVCEPVARVG